MSRQMYTVVYNGTQSYISIKHCIKNHISVKLSKFERCIPWFLHNLISLCWPIVISEDNINELKKSVPNSPQTPFFLIPIQNHWHL